MMTLDQIGIEQGTDKASTHHNYLPFYQKLLNGEANPRSLLEIGVQFGCSLKTWQRWFDPEHLVGFEIATGNPGLEGFEVWFQNAYTSNALDHLKGYGHDWDLIIDDGSHAIGDQQFVVKHYPWWLSEEGILIVEDIASDYAARVLRDTVDEGFNSVIVDFRTPKTLPDSLILMIWRK